MAIGHAPPPSSSSSLVVYGIICFPRFMNQQEMHSNGMLAASLSTAFQCLHGCDCFVILTTCVMESLDQGMDFQGIL